MKLCFYRDRLYVFMCIPAKISKVFPAMGYFLPPSLFLSSAKLPDSQGYPRPYLAWCRIACQQDSLGHSASVGVPTAAHAAVSGAAQESSSARRWKLYPGQWEGGPQVEASTSRNSSLGMAFTVSMLDVPKLPSSHLGRTKHRVLSEALVLSLQT